MIKDSERVSYGERESQVRIVRLEKKMLEDGIIFKITAGMFRCHWSSKQLAVRRKKGAKDMQSEEQLVLPSTTQS